MADPARAAAENKAWRAANPERQRRNAAEWRRKNPAKFTAIQAKHRAKKRNACPAWADKGKIEAVYSQARKLGLTVDHVYPLQGEFVSGLHVHQNLQLLSRADNAAKGNRYTPV